MEVTMEVLVFTMVTIVLLLIIIVVKLLLKYRKLKKKLKYVDDANMWHKLAVTDDLTGVYNRNAFNLRIDKLKSESKKQKNGLIIFDVDNFKMINDTMGHPVGDEILKKVAKILLEVFDGAEYRVYRIGGDEFSVLVEGDREAEVIERLLNLKSILAKNGDICLSKGYAFTHTNFKKAFRYADEMLYADKISRNTRNINKDDN